MREYLTRPDGMGLPRTNIHWLFDDTRSPTDQLRDVEDWLERREQQLKAAGTPATDLIVYYCGHGMFCGAKRAYHLAIRATNESSESLTSIPVSELARALNERARFLRKFLLLDCCFAGAAYNEFQAGPLQVSRAQLVSDLPARGTALLCAASAREAAIAPQGLPRTMFSDSLLKALDSGHPSLGPQLSLSELGALVRQNLKESFPQNWVRPEIHCPDQREGEVADVALFPNPGPARQEALLKAEREKAEEERRRKEAEAQLARQQAELERKTQALEEARRNAEESLRAEKMRLAKERKELERIQTTAQEREAAALRKAEENRKAELGRLQLAGREAEHKRRAEDWARAGEGARLDEQRRRDVDWREAKEAAEEKNSTEADRTRRIADNADRKKRDFRADVWSREARLGVIAVVAFVACMAGMKYWNSGSHEHPAETSVPSTPSVNNEPVTPKPGSSFRDCPELECPEMIEIPAGSFMMGSPIEGQHDVQVPAFSLGKYDVTFDEWDACVAAGGCTKKPSDQGWGRGIRPVINVTWRDAQEYAHWLSQKTGHTYRLPSEAEWEYAARAGTTTDYYWGPEVGRGHANCDGCGSQWDKKQTATVGSFDPNPWGLFDMAGNVWQWTQDCYHETYDGAPTDGSAWGGGANCSPGRVVRGGSWGSDPQALRSAYRIRYIAVNSFYSLGFRVSRTDF